MVEVRQIIELDKGKEWYVSYVTLSPCGCRYVRDTVKIKQKNKPNDKQIQNAVRNKRK